MSQAPVVAVVGAGGLVGREIVSVLAARSFPVSRLRLLSSGEGAGREIVFRGEVHRTEPLAEGWWRGVDLAFLALEDEASRREAPVAVAAGVLVVDNSAAFRLDEEVPLVVPEVNAEDLARHRGLVANPNCSTAQLVVALAPLEREAGLRRVVVSTYQSVSGAGAAAECALEEEIRAFTRERGGAPSERSRRVARHGASPFPHRIGFNLFPHIGSFDESGWCSEERKIRAETRKILHRPDLPVCATVVRVPVFRGHSEAVTVEMQRPLDATRARKILAAAPGVALRDDPSRATYPMPVDVAGGDDVLVGRVREDPDLPCTLHLWIGGDNLRKGAALNAVQIAEALRETVPSARAGEGAVP